MLTNQNNPHGIWSGKKLAAIGDSITEKLPDFATKNYLDYIHERTGITILNYGIAGSGFKQLEQEGKAFYQRINNVEKDADVYLFFGGGNDVFPAHGYTIGTPSDTGTDTICGAINVTLDNLYAINPLAVVGLVTPTPWMEYYTGDDNNPLAQISNKIIEIGRKRSIPALDLYHNSNLRPWDETCRKLAFSKDNGGGCHPDETGHGIIAPKFIAFLHTLI